MGFDARNRFEFVYQAVANLMEFPNFFETVPKERGFAFEFLAKGSPISQCRKKMVEHFVVPDYALVRRSGFETENFVPQLLGILRFEPDAFFRSKKHEKRSKENGNRDDEEYGEI